MLCVWQGAEMQPHAPIAARPKRAYAHQRRRKAVHLLCPCFGSLWLCSNFAWPIFFALMLPSPFKSNVNLQFTKICFIIYTVNIFGIDH